MLNYLSCSFLSFAILYIQRNHTLNYLLVSDLTRVSLFIHLHLKYFHLLQIRSRSKPVPFGIRLIPFWLSQFELVYFLLGLGWIGFRSDLVGIETWDDLNTTNDGEDAYKKVIVLLLLFDFRRVLIVQEIW